MKEFSNSFDEIWNRWKNADDKQRASRSENQILMARIQEMELEVQNWKSQVAAYEGAMQAYEVPMVERLRDAAQTIRRQEEQMAHLMEQAQDVAQQMQVIAHEATQLQGCVGDDTEEEQRLQWVLLEIRKLGHKIMPFAHI